MSACYCDYDEPWLVYRKSEPVARKAHRCYECGAAIAPGEKYERAFGITDDSGAVTYKTCPRCLALREWVKAHVPCLCWYHGTVIENCIDEAQNYAHEAPGLLFGAYRRQVAINRARVTK